MVFCLHHCSVLTLRKSSHPIPMNANNQLAAISKATPHNSKCRYGERGAADAKPKAQIILDAAKVSAASGGCSEPKQGQRSQSARGFCPRSTMRVPQPDIIEHFGNADAVPQPPERCLCAVLPLYTPHMSGSFNDWAKPQHFRPQSIQKEPLHAPRCFRFQYS